MRIGETSTPLVSIIIPVYNGSNFLRLAIESALAQTYQNTEVIVVDDGSNDEGATCAIAKSFGNRIRFLQKANGGVASALNFGISKMQGQFFSWLSHDDLFEAQKTEVQIQAWRVAGEPSKVIVYSDVKTIDAHGRTLSVTDFRSAYRLDKLETSMFPILNGLVHGCALLISRELFFEAGLFDEKLRSTQDYDLWNRMFRFARLIFVSQPLILSRTHENQGSHTIPNQPAEMTVLWLKIFGGLSPLEKTNLYGSEEAFFENALCFERRQLRLPEVFRALHEGHDASILAAGSKMNRSWMAAKLRKLPWQLQYFGRLAYMRVRKIAVDHNLTFLFVIKRMLGRFRVSNFQNGAVDR